jgi:predicted metal-binding membrane protein
MVCDEGWIEPRRLLASVREHVAWRHPEWWTLALSGGAWVAIATVATSAAGATGHGHAELRSLPDLVAVAAHARDWLLMIAAMMLPLSVGSIQATAARSLWRRRHRAIFFWLAGYLTPWLVLGLVVSIFTNQLSSGQAISGSLAALAFIAAGLWQVAPPRARALMRCHKTQPLAPKGWHANYDCVRYGWSTGVNCVSACGVLMVACWLLGHGGLGLAGMLMATGIGLAERYMIRPDQRWLAGALALQAAVAAAVA